MLHWAPGSTDGADQSTASIIHHIPWEGQKATGQVPPHPSVRTPQQQEYNKPENCSPQRTVSHPPQRRVSPPPAGARYPPHPTHSIIPPPPTEYSIPSPPRGGYPTSPHTQRRVYHPPTARAPYTTPHYPRTVYHPPPPAHRIPPPPPSARAPYTSYQTLLFVTSFFNGTFHITHYTQICMLHAVRAQPPCTYEVGSSFTS